MADAPLHLSDVHTARPGLAGRKIIITGGTTGIGRAIAVLLASEGSQVFICGRNPDHLADALARIRQVGRGEGISVDLADPEQMEAFFVAARDSMGRPDVVIVNAAIPAQALSAMTRDAVRHAIDVDFTACLLSAHAAQEMLGDKGDIVLIGSMSAHVLGPASTVYAGIKAGIAGFAEALRRELGPSGIRVSLVEPGKTGSDFQYPDLPPHKQQTMIDQDAMLRAEDIAVAVHYLLTQPRRTVVQQLTIVPRAQALE